MRSASPGCPSLGQMAGPRCLFLFGAGVRAWGPGTVRLARVTCGLSRAAGVAGGCPEGGLLTVVRGVWCQALPLSQLPVLGAGGPASLPMSAGRGWCGCGDPAPAIRRAPLRAGVARCGGSRRASPEGALRTFARGVWGQALSLPLLLPVPGAGSCGPLPTCCGRGSAGLGTRDRSFGVRALWATACRGMFPRGGGPLTVVRGVLGRPRCLLLPGAGGVGVETQHGPETVRSCEPALGAVRVAEERPREGCLVPLQGGSVVCRLSSPSCLSFRQAVGAGCPLAVGAGVQVWRTGTVPLACVPCGVLRAAGLAGGCPGGGGGSHCSERRLVSGALPLWAARLWGVQPGSFAHACWARVVCMWGPSIGSTLCARATRGRALWGWREGVLGWASSRCCEGRLGLGARLLPAACPWGRQPESAAHFLWVRACGCGDPALFL